jgi:YVTN family beta-propeller protein
MSIVTHPDSLRALRLLTCSCALIACEGGGNEPESTPGPVARIEFTADTFAVNSGSTVQVEAVPVDAGGRPVPDVEVVYTALDAGVAPVSESGVVSGMQSGPARIRASVGSVNATATVEVFGHPDGLLLGSQALGFRPFGVAVSRTGLVYVTQLDAAAVARLDTSLNVAQSIAVGEIPTGVAFSPKGDVAYVTNQWSQNVGVIDVARGQQTATIPIPADPYVPFVSPDGSKLYVTSNTPNVFVASTNSRAVTDAIEVTQAPNGFALHPDGGRIYVSTFVGGTVHEIDASSDAVLRTFAPGGMPQGLVVSKDGSELLIANESGWLDIYSLASGEQIERVPLAGGAFGAALSPDEQHLYLSLPAAGKVQVVNIPSRHVIHTIDVGGMPRRIAFTRHGGIAVIPNEGGYVSFVR